MRVFHVLKDGSTPETIKGHVVKLEDADTLYQYIHSINRRLIRDGRKQEVKQ